MSDFEIQFRTTAELEGAIALEKQLERQRGQAVALGKDYAAIDGKLANVRSSLDAFGKSSDENGKKLTEAFGRFGGVVSAENPFHSMRETAIATHTAFSALGISAQEAVHSLHLLFNPELLGVFAFSEAVKMAVEQFREYKKLLGEFDAAVNTPLRFVGPLASMKEAADKAGDSIREFTARIREMASAQQTLAEAVEQSNRAIEQQHHLESEIGKSQVDAQEAIIDGLVKQGRLQKEVAEQMKARIKVQQEVSESTSAIHAKAQEIEKSETARQSGMKAQDDLNAKHTEALKAQGEAQGRVDFLKKVTAIPEGKTIPESLEAANAAVAKAEEAAKKILSPEIMEASTAELESRRAHLQKLFETPGAAGAMGPGASQELAKLNQAVELKGELDRQRAQQAGIAGRITAANAELPSAQDKLAAAIERSKGTEKAATDNVESVRKLTESLDALRSELKNLGSERQKVLPENLIQQYEKTFGGSPKAPPFASFLKTSGLSDREQTRALELFNVEQRGIQDRLRQLQREAEIRHSASQNTLAGGTGGSAPN